MNYYLGVDVGTESVRVGLFDNNGLLVDYETRQIKIYNLKSDFYEQSSNNIWQSIVGCIKAILTRCVHQHSIDISKILSIGFDATCSLVVLDDQFNPVSVSPSGANEVNIIMWMDHRAKQQAHFINSTAHSCLKSVGNIISLEMDPPKLLWLKENMFDECYSKAGYFFSLPDFLVWRCSYVDTRSSCTTVCKWLFQSSETLKYWDKSFWQTIGLNDLAENNFRKIGSQIEKPFSFHNDLKISAELSNETGEKKESGLSPNVKVGISMIDAHAGGIGGLSVSLGFVKNLNKSNLNLERYSLNSCQIEDILVLVAGTSSCLMASSKTAKCINGIWGPYYEAMCPEYWLNEAGQSASGKLIDHLVKTHPAYKEYKENKPIFDHLNDILLDLAVRQGLTCESISLLTKSIHIYPDFHGNRSPIADSNMLGSICGLNFDVGLENLALVYLACVQALAYQTKQIITQMNLHGFNFKLITIIGGLAKNKMYCQLHSDICGIPVVVPDQSDSTVLLGAAIAGASNLTESVQFNDLLNQFSQHSDSKILLPNETLKSYHESKYKVFLKMIDDQLTYRKLMSS